MDGALNQAIAALLGAVVGGTLSVLASWLAQRVQTRGQWLSQEIQRRQQLYSEFVEAAARCYADALQNDEPNSGRLAKLYGDIGRMRLQSSDAVVEEANRIAHKILDTFSDANRTNGEIRDLLTHGSVDLFSAFGHACRAELAGLQPRSVAPPRTHSFRLAPGSKSSALRRVSIG